MKIKILGWSSQGLRIPDANVRLAGTNDIVPKFSFVQMPNGAGKTTTLELLRLALSGAGQRLKAAEVKEYIHFDNEQSWGQFTVDITVDGEPISYSLRFDCHDGRGKIQFESIFPGRGESNYEFVQPGPSNTYFSKQFSSFCITEPGISFNNPEAVSRFIDLVRETRQLSHGNIDTISLREVILDECKERLKIIEKDDTWGQAERTEKIISSFFKGEGNSEAMGPLVLAEFTLLLALVSSELNDVPLICESPSGFLDMPNRILLARLLNLSNNQFIGFIHQSERSGFITEIEKNEDSIKYFTLIGSDRLDRSISPPLSETGVIKNETGILVEGKEYFHAFEGFLS
jgi:hypothetical protein